VCWRLNTTALCHISRTRGLAQFLCSPIPITVDPCMLQSECPLFWSHRRADRSHLHPKRIAHLKAFQQSSMAMPLTTLHEPQNRSNLKLSHQPYIIPPLIGPQSRFVAKSKFVQALANQNGAATPLKLPDTKTNNRPGFSSCNLKSQYPQRFPFVCFASFSPPQHVIYIHSFLYHFLLSFVLLVCKNVVRF
jgi:hypothetical protein